MRTIANIDVTPLEIAKTSCHCHLYNILAPVILHLLPENILIAMENALHELINQEIVIAGLTVNTLHCLNTFRLTILN